MNIFNINVIYNKEKNIDDIITNILIKEISMICDKENNMLLSNRTYKIPKEGGIN